MERTEPAAVGTPDHAPKELTQNVGGRAVDQARRQDDPAQPADHSTPPGAATPAPSPDADTEPEPEPPTGEQTGSPTRHLPRLKSLLRTLLTSPTVRIAFLLIAIALGAYAVATQWQEVRTGFAELGPVVLLGALGIALAAAAATFAVWRGILAAFGSPLPRSDAARVFFVGQLGKYVPGSVWSVVAQMELGKKHAVPRSRSAAVAAVTMLISLTSSLIVAAVTLPWSSDAATDGYLWAFAVVPILLVALHPRIANPGLQALFRRLKRPPMERPLSGRDLFQATTRSLVAWLLSGAHVWLLAVQLGAPVWQTFLLATGGFAFAWGVGFLIVFAPAGAGVRELILIAALSPVLDPGKATAVALASRLVTILADLIAAGAAAAVVAAPWASRCVNARDPLFHLPAAHPAAHPAIHPNSPITVIAVDPAPATSGKQP